MSSQFIQNIHHSFYFVDNWIRI